MPKLHAKDIAELATRAFLERGDSSKFDAWLHHYERAVRDAEEWHAICKERRYSVSMTRTAKRRVTNLKTEEKILREAYRDLLAAQYARRLLAC